MALLARAISFGSGYQGWKPRLHQGWLFPLGNEAFDFGDGALHIVDGSGGFDLGLFRLLDVLHDDVVFLVGEFIYCRVVGGRLGRKEEVEEEEVVHFLDSVILMFRKEISMVFPGWS